MSTVASSLPLILNELRLPTVKRLWAGLAEQSNKEGWPQVFPEAAMTLAAVDRLVHHSTIFELNVESCRRRSAETGSANPARQPKTKKD